MTIHGFLAAAAAADITPDPTATQVRLHGYGARGSKTATGVHDRLQGKVLMLAQEGTMAVIITMDILQIDGLLVEAVAERAGVPGITKESIAICASHTHSAPAALQKRTQGLPARMQWYEPSYYEFCVEALAKAVREAASRLQPARVAVAKAQLGPMVRNRRVPSYDYGTRAFSAPVEPDIAIDDEMIVLRFVATGGEVIATLVNLAAHGTVLGADNLLVSADWAGYMQRRVEATAGGICLYSNGAEGNVAPDCGAGPLGFVEAETFGLTVAARIGEVVGDMVYGSPEHCQVHSRQLDLPDYQLSAESPYLRAGLERELVESFVRQIYPRQIQQTLIRLDDVAMLTIPGEMFTELSIDFKTRAKGLGVRTPMILGLANDSIGYLPSPAGYFEPGYETGMCVYGPNLGANLIDAGLEGLASLYSV